MSRIVFLIILVGGSRSVNVAGQEQPVPPGFGGVEITEVVYRDAPAFGMIGFLTTGENSNEGFIQARAKDVIDTLAPTVPILGVEHLPRDRRFNISGMLSAKNHDEVLSRLGDKLGLSITRAETTADFLIVRNLRTPAPPSWSPARPPAPEANPPVVRLKGISEVDKVDHLYNAYDVAMIDFTHFLSDRTTRPVWNQTSLTGAYSFSFRLQPEADVMKLLFDMGFDVLVAKRTTRCVVIAPKSAKK